MVKLSEHEKILLLNYIEFYVDVLSLEEIKQLQSKSLLKKFTLIIDKELKQIQTLRTIFINFLSGEYKISKKDILFILRKINKNFDNEISDIVLSIDSRNNIDIFKISFISLLRNVEKLNDDFKFSKTGE